MQRHESMISKRVGLKEMERNWQSDAMKGEE